MPISTMVFLLSLLGSSLKYPTANIFFKHLIAIFVQNLPTSTQQRLSFLILLYYIEPWSFMKRAVSVWHLRGPTYQRNVFREKLSSSLRSFINTIITGHLPRMMERQHSLRSASIGARSSLRILFYQSINQSIKEYNRVECNSQKSCSSVVVRSSYITMVS